MIETPDSVLLPYQQRWIADQSQIKIAEKSRRTGLTWAEAADAVLTGCRVSRPDNTYYIGSDKEMAKEFIDACAMWAKKFHGLAVTILEGLFEDTDPDGSKRHINTFEIKFNNGKKIVALSSNPRNLRGRQGNVVIDEAAFHERLQEVLKAALALTMWGSNVRIISTHNGYLNLFNDLIQQARSGRKRYSVHRITLDDAIADGLYKRICLVNKQKWSEAKQSEWRQNLLDDTPTTEDALEEYGCVPKQSAGSYLHRALIDKRMEKDIPVIRLEKPNSFGEWPEHLRNAEIKDWCEEKLLPLLEELNPNERHCFGEDFGRNGDLTVIAPMAIRIDTVRRVPFLVELRNIPFTQQEQILFYIVDRLPRLTGGAMDARGNGQSLAEKAKDRYGSDVIEQVMLSVKWYLENMPPFKASFEDELIIIPRDDEVMSDLRAIQVIDGTPKIPKTKTQEKGQGQRHGDAAVALCLGWSASENEGSAIEYTAAPNKNSIWDDIDNDDIKYGGKGSW